jgi:hypothetical protein
VRPRPTVQDWFALILLGALLGTIFLGIGGRIAMRVVAIAGGQPQVWTLLGTMTVILLGAANGALGALIRLTTAALVPGPRWFEAALFGMALALLTIRGLHPVQPLAFALFAPLVAAYAVVLETLWRRRPVSARHDVAADAAWRAP